MSSDPTVAGPLGVTLFSAVTQAPTGPMTTSSMKLPRVGPPADVTDSKANRVVVCPAGTVYVPEYLRQAVLPSTKFDPTWVRDAPGTPAIKRMVSVPSRPRWANDQEIVEPGTVATS